MSEKILLLAADLLDEYRDRLVNDGCNDWSWPSDWTQEEHNEFLAKFHEYNRTPADEIEDWGDSLDNTSVAFTLARAFREAAES